MLISVIVTAYNVEKYILKCLESISAQTYKDIEIVIVNDGSTDRTGNLIELFARKDCRVKYVSQKNSGLSAARNKGVKIASGEYITFVDGDDFISCLFVESLYNALVSFSVEMSCCKAICFWEGHEKIIQDRINVRNAHEEVELLDSIEALRKLCYQRPTITGAVLKMYKRELVMSIPFPEGKYFEDTATSYKFIQKSVKMAFTNRALYAYRYRSDSIMNERYTRKKLDCIDISRSLFEDITSKNRQLTNPASCAAFRINRIVIGQAYKFKEDTDLIWREILKYRDTVAKDKDAPKYERMLANISYFGKNIFAFGSCFFSMLRRILIRFGIKR
ncbi:glycosyltransferase family 2 protein [Butyrivibrio sp. XBB1001]|uniref:glycosyltransferase family 2 protein n=1 Tax=Butyrivibrio sp. XBB1001 TaxID=1280682 RepID=UPI000425398E|nr:glycosyltransferase family 2 protein [Butyrivibrio sp. XBB1001]